MNPNEKVQEGNTKSLGFEGGLCLGIGCSFFRTPGKNLNVGEEPFNGSTPAWR